MSKRVFLRRTALSLAASAGVFAATESVHAQIILNGNTLNAHSAVADGGLNARYWNFTTNNLYGNLNRPVNQFLPYENFDTSTRFLNGGDGYGLQPPLPSPGQANALLQQPIDFPVGNGADGVDTNPFDGTAALVSVDGILASWSGVFAAPEAGVYRFETVSDDATMIFIDGQTVVNNNAQQGMTRVGADVTLTAGNHEILITFQEGDGGAGVYAEWKAPSAGALSLIDPAASPTVFKNREVVDRSAETVTVTANSTIDVLASKAAFGDLTLTNSTLALTGTRLADATTFGATTATGASGINAGVDAQLASLNDGGGLTTFTKSGVGSVKIDGSSTMTNATTVVINAGSLSINATGGNQSIGNANVNLAGGILGIQNSDATAATIGNTVNVSGSSGISQSAGGGATITAMTMQPGATLTKTGANGANLNVGTVSVPGGGAITFNVRNGRLDTPAYNSGGTALTVNKTGGGTLSLPTIGTPLSAGGSFNVQAGVLSATNNTTGTSVGSTPVNLNGGTFRIDSVGQPIPNLEGLTLGYLPAAFDETTPNPGTTPNGTGGVRLDVIHGLSAVTPTVWFGDNETWVYTGQIFDADGQFSFGEHNDDNTLVRINGQQILRNTQWDVPTFANNTIADPDGDNWYDLEIRLGEGGGGQGPSGAGDPEAGWTTNTFGFGYSPDAELDNNAANFLPLVEPAGGGPTLLRTTGFTASDWTSAQIAAVGGNSTLDVAGNAATVPLGTIAMSNNGNLNVVGKSGTTIQNVTVAAGTASTLSGTATSLTVQNVQAAGATLNVGGTVRIAGTITGGKLGTVTGGTAIVQSTATFAGTPTIGTAAGSVMRFDAGAGTINGSLVSGNQLNDGQLEFAAGTTNLANAMLTASAGGTFEGLREGRVAGSFNLTAANPGVVPKLTLERAQSTDTAAFMNDSTWIYTGEINVPNNNGDGTGTIAFGENFDDGVLLRIDGVERMNNNSWNTHTTSGPLTLSAGWHSFEVRFGQGGGGVGPNADNTNGANTAGWNTDLGFGIDTDKTTFGLQRSEYVAPAEPAGGGPTLFRTLVEFGGVQVATGATSNLAGFRDHANVTVDGRLNLTPNGTNAGTSSVNALAINGAGIVDLANNDLIVRSTPTGKAAEKAAIQAEIVSAQNGPDVNLVTKWDGPGLTSSTARANNVTQQFDLFGIGVIINSDLDTTTGIPNSSYTTFSGQPVTPDDILVKYTYVGDANLSGAVSFDDYVGMDNAFFGLIPNLGWATGDINFDNVINFDDYSKVDQAFFFQGAPLSGEGGVAAVPEPGTWLLAALGSLAGLITWFRRRR